MKYLYGYEKIYEGKITERDLIESVDYNTLKEFYDNWYSDDSTNDPPNLTGLIDYFDNIWQYLDNDGFVEDWISEKVMEIMKDFQYNCYATWQQMENYIMQNIHDDAKNYIHTKYIEWCKEESMEQKEDATIEDMLEVFEEKNLRDIIENEYDEYDFCEWYLNEEYANLSAKEILEKEGYNTRDKDVFFDNSENIRDYLLRDDMENDWCNENPYEIDYDIMIDILVDDFYDSKIIQEMIWKDNCLRNSVIMAENGWANEILSDWHFQKDFVVGILEREKKEGRELKSETIFIFNKLKQCFLNKSVEIDDLLIEDYDLEKFIQADREGFIGR